MNYVIAPYDRLRERLDGCGFKLSEKQLDLLFLNILKFLDGHDVREAEKPINVTSAAFKLHKSLSVEGVVPRCLGDGRFAYVVGDMHAVVAEPFKVPA